MTISTYYTKLHRLWDEIESITPLPQCNCDGCKYETSRQLSEIRDNEKLYDLFTGFNDEYGTVKTQILSTKPTPSLVTAYHLISQDEQQRHITSGRRPLIEVSVLQDKKDVGRDDHHNFARDRSRDKGARYFDNCKKSNHSIITCYQIHGYPPGWQKLIDGGRHLGKNRDFRGGDVGRERKRYGP